MKFLVIQALLSFLMLCGCNSTNDKDISSVQRENLEAESFSQTENKKEQKTGVELAGSISSTYLNRDVKIWVYTPPSYSLSKKQFPVLYMHDGEVLFSTNHSGFNSWNIDKSLDKLADDKGFELVVVGIESGGYSMTASLYSKRKDELTPFYNKRFKGGQADVYLDFLTYELQPYIEEKYRVSKLRKDKGLMGSSFGGINTLYAMNRIGEEYSKYGIYSPSMWYSDSLSMMVEQESLTMPSKVVLKAGSREGSSIPQDTKNLGNQLRRKNPEIEMRSAIISGGIHDGKFWGVEFLKDIEWLFSE